MTRALVEFCGLPWDDNCLRFYENKRVVNTISYDQVRRPFIKNRSNAGKIMNGIWGRYCRRWV